MDEEETKPLNVNDDLESIAKEFQKDVENHNNPDENETMIDELKSMFKQCRTQGIKIPFKTPFPSGFKKLGPVKRRELHGLFSELLKEEGKPESEELVKKEVERQQRSEIRQQLKSGVSPERVKVKTQIGRSNEKLIGKGMFEQTLAITYLSEKIGNVLLKKQELDKDYDLTGWTQNLASQQDQVSNAWIEIYREQPEVIEAFASPTMKLLTIFVGSGVATIAMNDAKKNGRPLESGPQ